MMSEYDLAEHVRAICKDLGLLHYHTRDARGSQAGYPDWAICGPGGYLLRELKRDTQTPTAQQRTWIQALRRAGVDVAVWRPADLAAGVIHRELLAVARRRASEDIA